MIDMKSDEVVESPSMAFSALGNTAQAFRGCDFSRALTQYLARLKPHFLDIFIVTMQQAAHARW